MSLLGSHPSRLRVLYFYPTCITFAMCASQGQPFEISTPRYVYWSTIGNSSSPHFHLKATGFTLSSLHTTTAHFFTFAVTLHFLVYSSALPICFCNPSGVTHIPTESYAHINPETLPSPTVTPSFAASGRQNHRCSRVPSR